MQCIRMQSKDELKYYKNIFYKEKSTGDIKLLNLIFLFLHYDNRTNKGSEGPYSGFEEISLT